MPGVMPAVLLDSSMPWRQSLCAVTRSSRPTRPASSASSASSVVITLVRLAGARC